jgi:hypothetical protein
MHVVVQSAFLGIFFDERPVIRARAVGAASNVFTGATRSIAPVSLAATRAAHWRSSCSGRRNTAMRILLSLSGVMMLCASVVRGAGSLIAPTPHYVATLSLSEPSGLVVMGVGFVLLANQLRRKKL